MLQGEAALAPVEAGAPGPQKGVFRLAETGLELGLAPGAPGLQAAVQQLVEQPGGPAGLERQIAGAEAPAAAQVKSLIEAAAQSHPGGAAAQLQLGQGQTTGLHQASCLDRALELEGPRPGPAPVAASQIQPLPLAAQRRRSQLQPGAPRAGAPLDLAELQLALTGALGTAPAQANPTIEATGELAWDRQGALQGRQRKGLAAQVGLPAPLLPIALQPQGHLAAAAGGTQPTIKLQAAAMGPQAKPGGEAKALPPLRQRHQGRIGQAQAQIQTGRGDTRCQTPRHPVLALAVAAQVGPHPRQGHVQHGQAQAQAGQGIEAHGHGSHRHAGGIGGACPNPAGSKPQPGPSQPLVGAELKGMAQHPAQGLLQPGLPMLVEPAQGLVAPPGKQGQAGAAEGKGGADPAQLW